MERTPKIKKKFSLSLGRHQKRDGSTLIQQGSAGPKFKEILSNLDDSEEYRYRKQKSPSMSSISSDGGVVCTPPHKKFSLDDSVEYSPRFCDSINSPSNLLSQTLTSNSPEVSWKWGRHSVDEQIGSFAITPDSASGAENNVTSAGSSKSDVRNSLGRMRVESHTQRFAYEKQKEEHRRKLEIEMRRAEKLRADELLKQRCAKLEEQLRETQKRRKQSMESNNQSPSKCQKETNNNNSKNSADSHRAAVVDFAKIEDIFSNGNDTFDDFFNDSAADDILLEATQQVESKIEELAQKAPNDVVIAKTNSAKMYSNNEKKACERAEIQKRVSNSEQHEKRSSLYMKFLEDDSPDDWFLSLDDVILQATQQSKKPRNSFQRHNSMPTNKEAALATGRASPTHTTTAMTSKMAGTTSRGITPSTITTQTVSAHKIKRHASSHAFNSSSGAISTSRDRQVYSRK
ncbi:uncharacterized protein [Eurosta solidaginis]|uniref:uncharacterized protein n=1 Tax=Eurosta solidaginis TaxID=178769 RepID=UPI003530BF8F